MDKDELKELVSAMTAIATESAKAAAQEAVKAAPSGMTATTVHGSTGIFHDPVERDVITAHVRPSGIISMLPFFPSVVESPLFASITGVSGPHGTRATKACQDAPTGYMKGCDLTAKFGLTRMDTNDIEIDKVMLRANRGDFSDLLMRGRLLGMSGLTPSGLTEDNILSIVTKSEMVTAAVNAERQLLVDYWQGTIATGAMPGLDSQIATGIKDTLTGTLCPALDSTIQDFNFSAIDGTAKDIVEYLSMMVYGLEDNARRMGLSPVDFVIVMRPQLWYELSAVWPCRYMTNRCSNSTGTNVAVINDNVNTAMRDRMRQGLTIDINGKAYPVALDDGIYEYNSTNSASVPAGSFASSIYVIPLTINGSLPVTYREHVDYRAAGADTALLRGTEAFWTDDGIYLWATTVNLYCYRLSLKTEQRIILRTPQLAGKIQKVLYTPLSHLRDPFSDGAYFKDGGVSMRSAENLYAVWDGRQ
jgi:hypothetical protein